MKLLKAQALTLAFTLVFSSSVFAGEAQEATSESATLLQKCNNIVPNMYQNKFQVTLEQKTCVRRAMTLDPQYKDLMSEIMKVEDLLYAEENVLHALEYAQEPSAQDIRTQSRVVSVLKAKLESLTIDLDMKLSKDEMYRKYFYSR